MKRPTADQAEVLGVINKSPMPFADIDARSSMPLLRKGWARVDQGQLEITQLGRDALELGPALRLKPARYATPAAVVTTTAGVTTLRPEPMMSSVPRPVGPTRLPPAEDGMVRICCEAHQGALDVGLLVVISGRTVFAKACGKSWPVAFCPFCGHYLGGEDLNTEEEE